MRRRSPFIPKKWRFTAFPRTRTGRNIRRLPARQARTVIFRGRCPRRPQVVLNPGDRWVRKVVHIAKSVNSAGVFISTGDLWGALTTPPFASTAHAPYTDESKLNIRIQAAYFYFAGSIPATVTAIESNLVNNETTADSNDRDYHLNPASVIDYPRMSLIIPTHQIISRTIQKTGAQANLFNLKSGSAVDCTIRVVVSVQI